MARGLLVRGPLLCLTAYFLTDRLHERLSGAIFFTAKRVSQQGGTPLCCERVLAERLQLNLMAKASQLARNAKKAKLTAKYAVKRAELKLAGDSEGLQKLPKNSSSVRVKNRCVVTGRPRGYMRAFGLSRIVFRELAREGKIPGVKKASW